MQFGFYFDQTRCTGCFACAVACKDWHDIPAGPAKWMRLYQLEEGRFPDIFVSYRAMSCYHCKEPICSYVCPNDAIAKREEDGVVIIDREKCRGEKPCGIILPDPSGINLLYDEQVAPCQISCPVDLNIPGYVALIAKGRFKEALEIIRWKMPLPSVCGRVCLHPCESECRRQEVDKPIHIEALKRFVSDNVPLDLPQRLPRLQPDNVAIVGSGPAGLSAAYDLIRMGYGVTIFEALPVAGGMLSVGIPEYRLPREILRKDIDYIEALGVEIKTGTAIGSERSLDDLFNEGYGAVLLAVGAHLGQKLDIPGSDLEGIMIGTSFMRDVNLGESIKLDEKVLVIGGGNVALDCARTALRLGASDVHIACLESREQMPADKSEIKAAEDEGIIIHPSCTTQNFLGGNGKLKEVECHQITGLYTDENGQIHFEVVKDTQHIISANTVILAIGQEPDLKCLDGKSIVKTSSQGTIDADPETLMTRQLGVFCAGEAASGPSSVVDSIANGQQAAFYINRYLQGDVLRVKQKVSVLACDIKVEIPSNIEKEEPQSIPMLPVAERITGFREVSLGFSAEAAVAEADRCLNCAGHLCKDVCPYDAPQFADEEKAKMQKCDLCVDRLENNKKPICVEACPARALDAGDLDELRENYGDEKYGHGLVRSSIAQPSLVIKPKRRRID